MEEIGGSACVLRSVVIGVGNLASNDRVPKRVVYVSVAFPRLRRKMAV